MNRYSSRGILQGPNLHDLNITGVFVDSEKALNLYIEEDEIHVLKIPNLLRLKIDGFQQGNIVLDIQLVNESERLSMLRALYDYREGHEVNNRHIEDLDNGTSILMKITCSYGGAFAFHAACSKDQLQYGMAEKLREVSGMRSPDGA